MRPVVVSWAERDQGLSELAVPLELRRLVPAATAWEVELGFGKGRYLLDRAVREPRRGFVGVEMASAYHRLAVRRARRRRLGNAVLIRGEALLVLAVVLPRGFASTVHVYFPDPWPKARHQRRRLFDPESLDLVLGLLQFGGCLRFATDFLEYGSQVEGLLSSHPAVEVTRVEAGWGEGVRTNYEAKYEREGRSILRLQAIWRPRSTDGFFHPRGEAGILAATRTRIE